MRKMEVQLNALWIGPKLPSLHQACLLSAIRAGHKIRLYCYSRPSNLPTDIEVADAGEILGETEVMRHRESGSPSLSSNRFRYLLLQKQLGPWIDTDVFVVKPLTSQDGYMMAWQDDELVGSAILHLPSGNLTDFLCDFTKKSHPVPFWYPPLQRLWLNFRKAAGVPLAAGDYPWGVHGPHLLTNAVRKLKLETNVQPPSTYYPVGWRDTGKLYSGESNIFDTLPASTEAVHLWHHMAATAANGANTIQAGSFLDQAFRSVDMKPSE